MTFELDDAQGQSVGSVIKLGGRVLGIELSVIEAIVERTPPYRKVWETIGTPRLLVIGSYRMGFELSPQSEGCQARVFIEYAMPAKGLGGLLARLFGRFYAKWCTKQMLEDARGHFLNIH
jgi:hypothetical protein